jgi:hypothetical protein
MLVVSYYLLHTAVDRPDGRLHLYFSGNNKNPAILLISPAGDSFLIQSGSSASELFAFTDPRLPFPQRNLDGMMLTSNENIRLIEEIVPVLSPKDIFLLGQWETSNTLDLLPGTGTNSTHLPDGGTLVFGNGLKVALISNDRQPETVIISWLNFSAELVLEKTTQPPSCAGNVVYTLDTEADLSPACHPQIWISPDYGENTLPDVTLSQSGWLHIISDGNQIWLETQK